MAVSYVELPAESRAPRNHTPRFGLIHTTQGNTTIQQQAPATINWFRARGGAPASQGWGPSADALIDHLGNRTLFVRNGRDYHTTRANWSAGFGVNSQTTFGADEYGISIELVQTSAGERPPQATLNEAVRFCARLAVEYNWTVQRIHSLTQLRNQTIPTGFVGHEDTANGKRTGKWDPNHRTFPWTWFIQEIQKEVNRIKGQDQYVDKDYVTVRPNETLSGVAQRTGLTVAQLVSLNNIPNANQIERWQSLRTNTTVPAPPLIPFGGGGGNTEAARKEGYRDGLSAALNRQKILTGVLEAGLTSATTARTRVNTALQNSKASEEWFDAEIKK